MHSILPFLISLSATLILGHILVRHSLEWGFIDVPDSRKIHSVPTPRTGGLAMVGGCVVALAVSVAAGWVPIPDLPWQTWVAGLGFITVGGLDDRFNFRPNQKFFVMLAISALAAWPWLQMARLHWVPAGWPILLMIPATALTTGLLTFWFMAVPNAVNIEDAINGYMGGYTLIVLVGLTLRGFGGWLPVGALTAFLLFNWPKAKHFMGDAGSFGCGFLLAESILRGGSLLHPSMALALTAPISMDVAMGLIRRHRLGMSFFQADKATCPHHVLNLMKNSQLCATPLLWLNAIGFVILAEHPALAMVQAGVYAGCLVYLNRASLFHLPQGASHS